MRYLLLLLGLFACNLSSEKNRDIPVIASPTVSSVLDIEQTIEIPDAEWEILAVGLEKRIYEPGGNLLSRLIVLRIDPAQFDFRVHYYPGEAFSLTEWRDLLPEAVGFVNANFFTDQHEIIGLLVTEGRIYGEPYRDRGGTFAMQDGIPHVWSNLGEAYAGQEFEQAVQAFPMLVTDAQAVFFGASQVDGATRRTVVGQDAQGRILLMATPLLGLSLTDLSAFLAESDMQIVNAFNLDGGGSTMLYASDGNTISSFDPVPAVLAVYPRS